MNNSTRKSGHARCWMKLTALLFPQRFREKQRGGEERERKGESTGERRREQEHESCHEPTNEAPRKSTFPVMKDISYAGGPLSEATKRRSQVFKESSAAVGCGQIPSRPSTGMQISSCKTSELQNGTQGGCQLARPASLRSRWHQSPSR
jgi:hypothetical protein